MSARATVYTWSNSNGNVLINRTNYPLLTGGDTVYIPPYVTAGLGYRSQTYANLYCNHIAPTQAQLIHIIWEYGAYINPSTSSIQANSIDSVYGVEIRGCNQNDMIDPFFWSYGATGYLKYVLFNRDTLRGTNGFFGSYNPSLSLPAFTGDSTNCFYHIEWRACLWDSVIGGNSGETALWLGTVTLAKNQFWVYPTIDSCTFANYSSTSNPASFIHMETCFGALMVADSFYRLGSAAGTYVGHAADIYGQAWQFFMIHCIFDNDFGDGVRNIGAGQIKGWNTVPAGMGNPNGRSLVALCKMYNKIKYPGVETRTDPGDTATLSPYYQFRTCPEIWNITGWHMAIGVGHQDYNPSLVDCYENDSVFLKNSADVGPLADTTTWNFCNSIYCNTIITTPNGAVTVWDTSALIFDSTAALATFDTVNFRPLLNGFMYNNGISVPSYVSNQGDLKGTAMPVLGRASFNRNTGIDIGVNMLPNSGPQTGYYFSSSGSGTACSLGSPCAPSYLATVIPTLTAGDTVYLARGGAYGQITVGVSGSSGSHIVFRPYGTGAQPVIGGNSSMSFTSIGSNLWTAPYSGVLSPNFLLQNGVIQPISNSGIMTYTPASSSTTNLYVGSNASLAPVGTRIVVWSASYIIDTTVVTAQGANTLTVSPALTTMNPAGDVAVGWEIWHNTPSVQNQWNYANGTVTLYSTTTPNGWTYPTYDTVAYVSGQYIDFDSLTFTGGNTALIYSVFQTASGPTLNNCTLTGGYDLFFSRGASHVTINNCLLQQATDNAIYREDVTTFWTLYGDSIKSIGLYAGMGRSGGGATYSGINYVNGDSANNFTYISADSLGYLGLGFSGSSSVVNRNVVNNALQIKGDGGAIYTWVPSGNTYAVPDSICYNYVSKVGGAIAQSAAPGSNTVQCSYYLDAYSNHVILSNNVSDSSVGSGILIHGANNTVTNNIVHNSGNGSLWIFELSGGATITGTNVTNNQFAEQGSASPVIRLQTVNSTVANFGSFNFNHFSQSVLTSPLFMQNSSGNSYLTAAAWTALFGYESSSSFAALPMTLYGNPTQSTGSASLPSRSTDLLGFTYQNTVTLQARSGLMVYPIGSFIGPIPRGNRLIITN